MALVLQETCRNAGPTLILVRGESEMRDHVKRAYRSLAFFTVALMLSLLLSCGSNNSSTPPLVSSVTGAITTNLSDPPICVPPNGTYTNVWVTITKVTASTSGTAGATDSGWQTLADLTNSPQQVDLLSLGNAATMLGSVSGLPAGNYQQVRVYLLSNSPGTGVATPATNHCGTNAFNCVVRTGGSTEALDLGNETEAGIAVSAGQIAGGALNLAANQAATLDIDFDACDSIVAEGNGHLRLKPVVRIGGITSSSDAISGRIVVVGGDATSPIAGAIVMLEQPDPNNSDIDRPVRSALTASDGTFTFSPLPPGNYDVVAAAVTVCCVDVSTVYGATVTLKVPARANVGDIPLLPEQTNFSILNAGTINGMITATSTSNDTGADVNLSVSALQPIGGESSLLVTTPMFSSPSAMSTTNALPESSDSAQCGTGSGVGCTTYSLSVPASNPQVGTYSSSSQTVYTPPAALPAIYWVNAQAFVLMNASTNVGAPDCSPSSLPQTFDSDNQLQVSPHQTTTMNFSFSGCQ